MVAPRTSAAGASNGVICRWCVALNRSLVQPFGKPEVGRARMVVDLVRVLTKIEIQTCVFVNQAQTNAVRAARVFGPRNVEHLPQEMILKGELTLLGCLITSDPS